MSIKHPIISVTGSSGAGTTSVKRTFEQIFRRENVDAVYIEGDAYHRYDRAQMREHMASEAKRGNKHFSHFSPDTNLLEDLEKTFRDYGAAGTGTFRRYVHDAEEAGLYGAPAGPNRFSTPPNMHLAIRYKSYQAWKKHASFTPGCTIIFRRRAARSWWSISAAAARN